MTDCSLEKKGLLEDPLITVEGDISSSDTRLVGLNLSPIISHYDRLSNVYFFIKNTDRKFLWVNRALADAYKKTKSEVIGHSDEELPGALAPWYRHSDEFVIEEGQVWKHIEPIAVQDDRNTSKDMRRVQLRYTVKSPLATHEGKILGLVGVSSNLADREGTADDCIMHDAIMYMRDHCKDATIPKVSNRVKLSGRQLVQLTNDRLGVSPSSLLRMIRVETACNFLAESPLRISDIAKEVGYQSGPHLTVAFKKVLLMTPGEYRKSSKAIVEK